LGKYILLKRSRKVKKEGEGRRYMNTVDIMSMEGGQRLDALTGNGRD
jgi:hypothetical protein